MNDNLTVVAITTVVVIGILGLVGLILGYQITAQNSESDSNRSSIEFVPPNDSDILEEGRN